MYEPIEPKLCAALIKARAEIKNPLRDAKAQRHKYAKLETICEMINPILAKHDLTFIQRINNEGSCVTAETILIHSAGGTLSAFGPSVPAKSLDAHGVGAAATYAKRYSLTSFFGIEATADDDGKEAMKQGGGTVKELPPQPAPKDAPGVDESGMDELEVKRRYSTQINRLNASAKEKDVDLFATEWARIPQEDRVAVHGACLSHVRTFGKRKDVREAMVEAEESFGVTEDVFVNMEAPI